MTHDSFYVFDRSLWLGNETRRPYSTTKTMISMLQFHLSLDILPPDGGDGFESTSNCSMAC
jgi:hypothetical protein